jgi:hypothetical protein
MENKNQDDKNETTKKNDELIIIKNKKCHFPKNKSLQENFKSFRQYVNNIRKDKKNLNKIQNLSFKDNPQRIESLRIKFIETAKTLLGVPYGKKYLIEHPEYKDDFFLDCCGLIRQVVYLMREDLGFTLGRWNQSYQYDMLDEEIPFEKIKPGDLVFYSADYFPNIKRKKKHIHDMVHVEILLGEGEKTIGSRKKKSVVNIFDSYKLKDNKYYRCVYHFKSIEPWLRGILKSYCKEHAWNTDEKISEDIINKYSAFNQDSQSDDEETI